MKRREGELMEEYFENVYLFSDIPSAWNFHERQTKVRGDREREKV